jgi:hypothetical protein
LRGPAREPPPIFAEKSLVGPQSRQSRVWHKHYHSTASGHLYQNRFNAFAIVEDEHLLTVLRWMRGCKKLDRQVRCRLQPWG